MKSECRIVQNEVEKCPKWGKSASREWKAKRGQVESENHYAQRVSKVSEWLSKMKKRISLCLCVFVREMVLKVLHSSVQIVQNDCKTENGCAQRLYNSSEWVFK